MTLNRVFFSIYALMLDIAKTQIETEELKWIASMLPRGHVLTSLRGR